MTITYDQAKALIDVLGYAWAYGWYILQSVVLYTDGTTSYSVLDGFCIAGFVVDLAWEILDEMRP